MVMATIGHGAILAVSNWAWPLLKVDLGTRIFIRHILQPYDNIWVRAMIDATSAFMISCSPACECAVCNTFDTAQNALLQCCSLSAKMHFGVALGAFESKLGEHCWLSTWQVAAAAASMDEDAMSAGTTSKTLLGSWHVHAAMPAANARKPKRAGCQLLLFFFDLPCYLEITLQTSCQLATGVSGLKTKTKTKKQKQRQMNGFSPVAIARAAPVDQ